MMNLLNHIQFRPPDDFVVEESKVIFQAPGDDTLYDPQLALLGKELSKQKTESGVRPNLIIRTRQSRPDIDLPYVAMELAARSFHNLGITLQDLDTQPFVFSDQVQGVLVLFSFPAKKFQLCQYHAFRLDGNILTQLTYTLNRANLSELIHRETLACLAAVSLGSKE